MTAALLNYQARMQRVLDYIDQHLDDGLDLETVSAVAAFSKYHFHRQFTATFELSLHRYIQLARMKRASHRLSDRSASTVTEIALDIGYDAPDAFARAFRRRVGQSPSSFRKSPDWGPWLTAFAALDGARSKLIQPTFSPENVTIREVPSTPVAVMEHRGDRASIPDTARRFHAWRKAHGVSPKTSSSFTVFRSEREPSDPAGYAMDLCVAIEQPIAGDDDQVKAGVIPGGRCAVMQVNGASNNHLPSALYMYRDWLPTSGEEARDFPMYCQRRLIVSGKAEGPQVFAELFLPLTQPRSAVLFPPVGDHQRARTQPLTPTKAGNAK